MKKTTKMVGAVACAAALAMGCALPAFAADPVFPDDYAAGVGNADKVEKTQGGTVDTQVKVATVVTNINVAVPIDLTIVANSAGGQVVAPSDGVKPNGGMTATGYRIENYSEYPIAIKNIKTSENGTDWKLVASIPADKSRDVTKNAGIGDLALDLTPSAASATGNVNEGNQSTGGKVDLEAVLGNTGIDPKWTVAKGVSKTVPSIMGLTLSGESSQLQNVHAGSVLEGTAVDPDTPDPTQADDAFKIIYTVAVG